MSQPETNDVPRVVIDTHVHLWDPADGYEWQLDFGFEPALRRPITADEARAELDAAGVDQAILVQADNTARDTDRMLATAATHPWIAGVVGWIPLEEPTRAGAALDARAGQDALRGIRHLVHFDARGDVLERPGVRASLALVAERGLAFEVPDAWPRHLAQTSDLASALPELTIVIDHLAKPPFGGEDWDAWAAELVRAAERPNTVAKVSGLHAGGVAHADDVVRPAWELALDLFGPDRLMYGSDWPMTAAGSGYASTWRQLGTLIAELGEHEQKALYEGTARRVYGL